MFVKVGVLEPAEAEAPATPSKEAVKGSIETGVNPLSHTIAENFHTETLRRRGFYLFFLGKGTVWELGKY